jgi:hypothetical protein
VQRTESESARLLTLASLALRTPTWRSFAAGPDARLTQHAAQLDGTERKPEFTAVRQVQSDNPPAQGREPVAGRAVPVSGGTQRGTQPATVTTWTPQHVRRSRCENAMRHREIDHGNLCLVFFMLVRGLGHPDEACGEPRPAHGFGSGGLMRFCARAMFHQKGWVRGLGRAAATLARSWEVLSRFGRC